MVLQPAASSSGAPGVKAAGGALAPRAAARTHTHACTAAGRGREAGPRKPTRPGQGAHSPRRQGPDFIIHGTPKQHYSRPCGMFY